MNIEYIDLPESSIVWELAAVVPLARVLLTGVTRLAVAHDKYLDIYVDV